MGEITSQIEREIRAERTELGRNLRELESKARDIADWRTHHRNHPGLFLGLAFSGGLMLGLLATPSRRAASRPAYAEAAELDLFDEPAPAPSPRQPRMRVPRVVSETGHMAGRQLGETWEHIASALLGVASAKAVEVVAELIPGFRDHYDPSPAYTKTHRSS